MDVDNLPADEEFQPDDAPWDENDTRAFRHLRDVFAEVVRPYVAVSLGMESKGYAYDDRAQILGIRDEILYGPYGGNFGGNFGDDFDGDGPEGPAFDMQDGNELEGPDENEDEGPDEDEGPAPQITEQEIDRASTAVATALAEEWLSAIVETAMTRGKFALDADLLPDNFDPEPLYMYPIDPKEDLGPIMLGITERLFDEANPVELPLGLQITEDSALGKYVVAPKFRLG